MFLTYYLNMVVVQFYYIVVRFLYFTPKCSEQATD